MGIHVKLPFTKGDPPKPRPYWHVDAKWLCALLLVVALVLTLPVAAVHKLTARGPATDLIAYTFAGLTSPQGIDSEVGLDEVKKRVLEKGSETLTIAGISVVFTAEDMTTLSPRELRLKVFRTLAERLYDQGARDLAKSQGFDEATVKKFQNDASFVSVFTAKAHAQVGKVLMWMVVADMLLLAGLVYFSRRFGRLVSPGLVLLFVGLPGIILGAIASQNPEVTGTARSESPSDQMAMLGLFAGYVAPLIVPHLASVYLAVLAAGGVLLLFGGVGRTVYGIMHHHATAKPEPAEKPAKNSSPKQ